MSLAQGNHTPTRRRIEPGSPDPESDALTIRPVRSPFANVKKRCANREETLVDMCRVMSKPVFWIIDQVRTNLMTWIMIMMTYMCIMWSNAISVRTSAVNSSRQPKIRVLKFHDGPCLWQMLKVANTWYILLV